MSIFVGSGVAIVTPFTEDGVNFEKLKELIEWHISSSTDAIVICGTSGEASTMSLEEKKETIKFTVDVVNKRIPVIAGTGSNNTNESIKMSKWAESIGVDGLLVITPYYNKTTQKGLIEHFKAINDAVNIPIVLYNVPGRTGMNLNPETLYALRDLKNIKAIKEASGNISQIAKMKALCKDRFDIYSGNDDQIVPILSLGGKGVISVIANILPTETHDMVISYVNGETDKALDLQLKMMSLCNALFIETNPIPIKTALNLIGYKVGSLRLPLCEMSDKNLNLLKDEIKAYGLALKED
ncbi:4-hydroxy-tetrahydrodipicolinate synthase 1 [Clostridium pasteurianum DSM 525 = ATCC 6013]|uniref:4-hydroxy-tetrahydrodipicolinate synthase n=1 Tax=Clostridium pasteurianum DSM 525 = ATCC 6013 TaxID=1262449 RepID=A0A0H3J2Q5_CLOPA|nr:4-hydroxy-tetrahydrodipicolinate synthase [Clostridium pasteurianum]AJA47734.1 4-hydroxy-tetrahydrodipicolinate synthase 1 [Clostridium pasteurianum DSM 525 = ATCC 6013]AJA51722.1 4-hydroxy-tetrahydrodipicolinate synthase 1 [Clostridium pasteurianum DSM 525 = ATCC 6013]AOZ75034.1 4-hydroxy-tetrahydrodipicolinate synthase [Clostridium pasteurianum DSM 525 = ATCC 6013]AOZ78829.1 4-hydroxy-tetrahydrodipicolinate synthase [Clostridium pasteurianum]ELP59636.1 dihydrodipicolinate synthase [Clostr